jgi:hypothetical protein
MENGAGSAVRRGARVLVCCTHALACYSRRALPDLHAPFHPVGWQVTAMANQQPPMRGPALETHPPGRPQPGTVRLFTNALEVRGVAAATATFSTLRAHLPAHAPPQTSSTQRGCSSPGRAIAQLPPLRPDAASAAGGGQSSYPADYLIPQSRSSPRRPPSAHSHQRHNTTAATPLRAVHSPPASRDTSIQLKAFQLGAKHREKHSLPHREPIYISPTPLWPPGH